MKTDIHNKDFARRLVLKKKKGELGNGLLVGCPVLMSVKRYPVVLNLFVLGFWVQIRVIVSVIFKSGLGGHYHLYRPV